MIRAVLCVALLMSFASSAQEKVELNAITGVTVRGNVIEIVGSKKPNFTTFTMADPPRLVIDISEAVFRGVPNTLPGVGHITGIKTASYGSDASAIARVLVGFDKEIETDIQTEGDTRLMVKMLNVGGAEPVENAAAEKADAGTGVTVAAIDPAKQTEDSKAAEKRAADEKAAQDKAAKEAADAAKRDAEAAAKAEKEAAARAEADRKKADEEAKLAAKRAAEEQVRLDKAAKEAEARAKKEAEAQLKAQKEAEEKARREEEQLAKAQKAEEERARKEAEKAAAAEAKRTAEEEKKQKAEAAKLEAQQKREAEAAAKAAAEADRKAKADQARAEAEARKQAALDEKAAKEQERQAKLEAEKQAKEDARRAVEDEKRRKAEAAQAVLEAKKRAAEEAQAAAEEKKRAAEEAKAAAEAARHQSAEQKKQAEAERKQKEEEQKRLAMADKPSFTESVQVSSRRKTLSFVGFAQQTATSRIYVRTNEPVRYSVGEDGKLAVVLMLDNTAINMANNARQLDTSYFDTAVAGVKATPGANGAVRVEITLKNNVPYSARQQGNEIWVEFARPVRH